jgi:hypothetical protein
MKKRLAILLLLTPTPSLAENPFTILQSAGLLGTWTTDCTQPILQSMLLYRFTQTSLGFPRLIISNPDTILSETAILSATQSNNTIQLTTPTNPLTLTIANGTLQISGIPSPLHRCISE